MNLDHQACYRAITSRDNRFDGKFFTGVTTTGIYCRPVCRAKRPNKANVEFYKSAPAAELAGYRPCLRCRPELAPGYSSIDSKSNLAIHAKLLLDQHYATNASIQDIASRLGISDRYLRLIFKDKFGVRPIDYLQSRRLLTAKQLLTSSQLKVSDIAYISGFNSVRRMNSSFKKQYRLAPTSIRLKGSDKMRAVFCFELHFRPPYAFQNLMQFLQVRLLKGMEHISSDNYLRTLALPHPDTGELLEGWISIKPRPGNNALHIKVSDTLVPCFMSLRERIILSFDLSCCPETIFLELKDSLPAGMELIRGLRIPGGMDFFEVGVRAILGQQVKLQTATTLTARFLQKFGRPMETPYNVLNIRFPRPAEILNLEPEQIASIGIFRKRAQAIIAFAQFCFENDNIILLRCRPEQTISALLLLPGIGPWTAHYIAMRGLNWQSAGLETDVVVKNSLCTLYERKLSATELRALRVSWQPWSSYVYLNIWSMQLNSSLLAERK